MGEIESAIEELYANNARKLRNMCQKEMARFGGISQKDYDDFYSRAGLEISLAKKGYDASKGKMFMEYISGVVRNAVWKEMTDRNRSKRQAFIVREWEDEKGNAIKKKEYVPDISIESLIGEEGGIAADKALRPAFYMDRVLCEELPEYQNERMEAYLKSLSKIQRQIAEMKMDEEPVSKIKEKLRLTDKQYERNCREMKSFAKIRILFGEKTCSKPEEEDEEMDVAAQTMENCKAGKISIASLVQKIDRHAIRFDHPLQRESDQWSPSMKGNLVSDILQGNKLYPLVFAEQIINGVPVIWNLDGKQRCANAYTFSKNGYKVSKNIRRWNIPYQTTKKDKNGFWVAVNAEFDIRGKKFLDLPAELRDRFLGYSFSYDQYLNCSERDIGYHIERYNDGKPMTSPQKGITKLGTRYAEFVKSISNMPFFKDMGGYKVSEFLNGTIGRVVVESIMAANYLDKWNKLEDMCEYIRKHVDASVFDGFKDMVERLERAVTDDVSDLFDSNDSFLWFGLFARFSKTETDDKKFIEFMSEFRHSLHEKEIGGESFDSMLAGTKSAKDKEIVTKKINCLERLMKAYFERYLAKGKPGM